MIARILLWDLTESSTTLAELSEHLPLLPEGDAWIANEAHERFGLVSFSDELPDLQLLVDLIGEEPIVAEDFDVLEV